MENHFLDPIQVLWPPGNVFWTISYTGKFSKIHQYSFCQKAWHLYSRIFEWYSDFYWKPKSITCENHIIDPRTVSKTKLFSQIEEILIS